MQSKRVLLIALVGFLCLLPDSGAQATLAGRDWNKYPVIVEVDTPEDVYALGDVHGDYERLLTVLVAAKIIPADPGPPDKVQWQAAKAVLVCTGDFIDKYDQSMRVIALLRALQGAAEKAGGRLVITLGNHEAEFLANPRVKKAAEFVKELEGKNLKPEDVAAGRRARRASANGCAPARGGGGASTIGSSSTPATRITARCRSCGMNFKLVWKNRGTRPPCSRISIP